MMMMMLFISKTDTNYKNAIQYNAKVFHGLHHFDTSLFIVTRPHACNVVSVILVSVESALSIVWATSQST
jgi:hypothetical protein